MVPDAADMLLAIAGRRPDGRTLCPSEVARALAKAAGAPDAWREHMANVHRAAFDLAAEGRLEVLQRGRVVGPGPPKGAYRLRLPAGRG